MIASEYLKGFIKKSFLSFELIFYLDARKSDLVGDEIWERRMLGIHLTSQSLESNIDKELKKLTGQAFSPLSHFFLSNRFKFSPKLAKHIRREIRQFPKIKVDTEDSFNVVMKLDIMIADNGIFMLLISFYLLFLLTLLEKNYQCGSK